MPLARILLVDDEAPLVKLLRTYLERLGYAVMAHVDPNEAWIEFQSRPADYDLVIADLGMPQMPGRVLLERMLRLRPDLHFLVCSGSSPERAELPEVSGRCEVLQKPFTPNQLAAGIEKVLGRDSLRGF